MTKITGRISSDAPLIRTTISGAGPQGPQGEIGPPGADGKDGVDANGTKIEVVTQTEYDSLTPVGDTFYYIKEVEQGE